jgi:hypothetical protein
MLHKPCQINMAIWCGGELQMFFGITAAPLFDAFGSSLSKIPDVFPMCGSENLSICSYGAVHLVTA